MEDKRRRIFDINNIMDNEEGEKLKIKVNQCLSHILLMEKELKDLIESNNILIKENRYLRSINEEKEKHIKNLQKEYFKEYLNQNFIEFNPLEKLELIEDNFNIINK